MNKIPSVESQANTHLIFIRFEAAVLQAEFCSQILRISEIADKEAGFDLVNAGMSCKLKRGSIKAWND